MNRGAPPGIVPGWGCDGLNIWSPKRHPHSYLAFHHTAPEGRNIRLESYSKSNGRRKLRIFLNTLILEMGKLTPKEGNLSRVTQHKWEAIRLNLAP